MAKIAAVVRLLRKEHDRLSKEIRGIAAALAAFGAAYGKQTRRRNLSEAARARISAAQKARWAKVRKNGQKQNVVTMPKKRTLSASARRKIAPAQRARWAKVKAAKKAV